MCQMDALEALKGYGGDDSSSETEDEADESNMGDTTKDNKSHPPTLPKVPTEILSMFEEKTDVRCVSDSSKHKGRSRSFPHVAGNWATFVYVEVPYSCELEVLVDLLLQCLPTHIEAHLIEDIHISVSRTVALQYHWIDPFIQDLRTNLQHLPKFSCFLQDIELFMNDEKTRSFLSLKVGLGQSQLKDIVQTVDGCLNEFALPPFYEKPSFHASCVWFLGDHSCLLDEDVKKKLNDCFLEHGKGFEVKVGVLHCKSGCKKFLIDLER